MVWVFSNYFPIKVLWSNTAFFSFWKIDGFIKWRFKKENEDALKVSMFFKSNWDKWNESIECSEEPMSWSLLFRAAAMWKRTFSFFSILIWIRASMADAFLPVVFQLVVCPTWPGFMQVCQSLRLWTIGHVWPLWPNRGLLGPTWFCISSWFLRISVQSCGIQSHLVLLSPFFLKITTLSTFQLDQACCSFQGVSWLIFRTSICSGRI